MRYGLACLALALATPSWAQDAANLPAEASGQSAQGDVSLTIYSNDIALIQDVRTLDLPRGQVRRPFADVSAAILPQTVSLQTANAEVVEQNFDYDLLSPTSLIQKAVGETVTLIRTNPATGAETRERARVLAVNGGVVLDIGGRIEVLRDDGLPVRVIFDRVPDSLLARPTLSVTLDSQAAGVRPVTLSYLSRRLGWSADYVALFDEAAGTIDVQGWITLSNQTGTSFPDARLLLVAGEVGQEPENRYGSYRSPPPPRPRTRAGTETASREQLGDFYLYPLGARTTVADKQTKQVSFLDVSGARASSGYRFVNGWQNSADAASSADSVLRFSNAAKGGLGDALPAGTVRVYVRDARGQPQFTGEDAIGHTPQGSDLALKTGSAFDVKVQPVVVSREQIRDDRWRTTYRYTLTNARPKPVTVELVQAGTYWGFDDTRIVSESRKSERPSADQAVWQVPVPANGEAVVTATFETRY